MIIELTNNELEVLKEYLIRKTSRLEESGLSDSKCCLAMMSILFKIYRGEENDTRKKSAK